MNLRHRLLSMATATVLAMPLSIPLSTTLPAHADDPVVAPAALNWASCSYAPRAQCTTLEVPRDWAAPRSSGTYRISVARVPAARADKRIGVLMFNPGGPGSGAVTNLSWVLSLLPSRITDRFDIVAVDPRGVGGSQPSINGCSAPQHTPPATGKVDWLDWSRTFMRANKRANRTCLTQNREQAETVGTWQIVRDLDAVRAALGERSITFWGMSYGTTIGRAYAQAFPIRVRALLLDGTISPVSSITSWAEEHTWDDRLAIDTMVASLGPAYVDARTRVLSELEKRSVRAPNGTVITRWTVGRALVAWSSFHTTWGSAGNLLLAVRDALFASTPDQRAAAASRAAGVIGSTPATGQSAWLSPQWTYVNCSDFTDRPTARTLARLAEKGAATGGAGVGMAVLREGAQCAGLPQFGRPLTAMTTPLRLRTPPTIVNARADNRTPWTAAVQTSVAFPGSRLIAYSGTHHILYGRRTACIDEPITRYLIHRRLPATTVQCDA
jgi:pimeloyl-ACP methyl ester carboxylesterase